MSRRFADAALGLVVALGIALLFLVWAVPEFRDPTIAGRRHQATVATASPSPPASDAGDPPGYKDPCEAGQDNRRSDLCAQWKAADAAEQSALWTTIGVIVSGLTLLAAGAAAKFARDAALHTETGANAAKDALDHAKATSKLELRAYIDVADARLEGDLFSPVMVIAVKNFGQTLAKVVQVRTVVDLGREPLPEPTLPDEWRTDSGIQLAPGNDWIFRFPYDVQQAVEADGKGGVIARVTGQVRYFDVTGEKRETHFRIRTAGHRLGENMRIFPDKIGNYIT